MLDLITGGWISPYLNIQIPKGQNKKLKKLAKQKNNAVLLNQIVHNQAIALDRYYIDGLPDTCSQRVILQSLLWYGKVMFFQKIGNVYALPCVNSTDGYTVYGEWRSAYWVGLNGQTENVNLVIPGGTSFLKNVILGQNKPQRVEDGVLVRENSVMYPFINYVIQYSEYEADTLRTLDTARIHLKHPYMIVASEEVVNSVQKWYEDQKDNMEMIISTGAFPTDSVTIQDLNVAGDVVNNITALYEWYDAQYKGLCGIDHNKGIDKKGENLLTSEISVDAESDNTNLNICMDYIQQGLDEANDHFGLNMHVRSKHINDGGALDDDYTGYDDIQPGDKEQSESNNGGY